MASQPSNKEPRDPDSTKHPESSHRTSLLGHTARPGMSPRSTSKVAFAEPDSISPLMIGKHKEIDKSDQLDLDRTSRHFPASVHAKRLSGRPSLERLGSAARSSFAGNPSISSLLSEDSDVPNTSPNHRHAHESLVKQVTTWLKHEKARRTTRRAKRKAAAKDRSLAAGEIEHTLEETGEKPADDQGRRGSDSSEGSIALESLANILERTLSTISAEASPRKRRASGGSKVANLMKRFSIVSSDTDYFEGAEELVPTCEAVLDNSQTLAYSGGAAEGVADSGSSIRSSRRAKKDKEAWATFKYEILRLAHTLKLKGWRKVPLEQSGEIEVERLSGALTNAVYVVSPPKNLELPGDEGKPKSPPPKLLLRIYGPQVEHLIDREAELRILRRLARKRIGPRLLGTFTNGRFEEFLYAQTLTPKDLRDPETSKQIAKRMRELHEGIDLLREEREAGPFVWQNYYKWINICEKRVTWLDQQVQSKDYVGLSKGWKQDGPILGAEWEFFKQTVEKYRKWLVDQYGGQQKLNERLVFAHNDAQYGNILRLEPAGESPLLLPANEHKQLVVIDFEYANANLPGLEFANHFTEWTYNYHDSEAAYRCNASYYPTPEEQHRFVRAYLLHTPMFKAPTGAASNPPTPYLGPLHTSGSTTALAATAAPSSINAFVLDARAPPGESYSYQEQEAQAEQEAEEETKRLMAETRLWRLANSAHWTAWGIVQANIPGLPVDEDDKGEGERANEQAKELDSATLEMRVEADAQGKAQEGVTSGGIDGADVSHNEEEQHQDEDEEFDYLAYAHERALFFWGDAIALGIIRAEELPEEIRKRVKIVEY